MTDLLQKVISTSTLGAAPGSDGLLKPQQADRFIDYIFDATVLGPQVDTIRMNGNELEISTIGIGERLVRKATEATADHVVPSVNFNKVSLRAIKLRVDWELSRESLEDNIEGADLEDHIARMIAQRASNDLEYLAINGNVNLTEDWLLSSFDGWRKRLYAGGHVIDAAGANLDKAIFNRALRTLPRDFQQNRGALKWFSATGLIQDYLYDALLVEGYGAGMGAYSSQFQRPASEAQAAAGRTNVAAGNGAGWTPAAPFGIALQEVNLFPEYLTAGAGTEGSEVWLTNPSNLVWGIQRDIEVFKEFKPKKDSIEYTMFTRVGAAVRNPLGSVIVKNVAYKDNF